MIIDLRQRCGGSSRLRRLAGLLTIGLVGVACPTDFAMAGEGESSAVAAPPQAAQGEKKEDEEIPQERRFVVTVEESASPLPSGQSVGLKLPADPATVPASVSVVTHPLFKSQDAVILSDALVNVAGVNIQPNFGVHDLFYIRGFDSLSSGLILLDEAPEPEATFYYLYNVDQVEVLRGPGAFLYGGNPLSGTVNLVRKRPQFGNFWQASGTIGSFGVFRGQYDLNVADPDGPVAFRFNMMGLHSDGYRDGRDARQVGVNPALTWRLSDRSQLTLNFEYVDNRYGPDAGIPLLFGTLPDGVPRERSYSSPFDDSDQSLNRFRLDWETRLAPSIMLRDKFYYTRLDWTSSGTLIGGVFPFPDGSFQVIRFLNRLEDEQGWLGNQFEAVMNFHTGPLSHQLLAGVEVARLTDEFSLDVDLLPTIDLYNPRETAREPLFPIPGAARAGDARSYVLAPYVADQISIGSQVNVMAGGRLDTIDFDDPLNGIESRNTEFSPMLGLLVGVQSPVAFYANFGKAFSPPSTLTVGEREPERSRQFEVGLKHRWLSGRLQGSVAYYDLKKENIAIQDQSGITRREGDQQSEGLEVELAAEFQPGWYGFLNYSFNDSELTRFSEFVQVGPGFEFRDWSGNTSPFAPRNILNFWTTKEFPNGIGIGGGVRHLDSQFIAPDNQFEIDSSWVLDAVVSYRLENWRLSFNLKNLTNEEYETRGFGSQAVIPGESFAVFATVQFTR